jgi:hypothetical protein
MWAEEANQLPAYRRFTIQGLRKDMLSSTVLILLEFDSQSILRRNGE